jgi:hypothetical protein
MNMEYRGIEYTVVQGIQRGLWKWSAFVAGARISGQESVRSAAVTEAESAIDRALADPRKPIFGASVDGKRVHGGDPRAEELNSLRLALATFALKLDAFEARIAGLSGNRRRDRRSGKRDPRFA